MIEGMLAHRSFDEHVSSSPASIGLCRRVAQLNATHDNACDNYDVQKSDPPIAQSRVM
jgi:hypothetical protein